MEKNKLSTDCIVLEGNVSNIISSFDLVKYEIEK